VSANDAPAAAQTARQPVRIWLWPVPGGDPVAPTGNAATGDRRARVHGHRRTVAGLVNRQLAQALPGVDLTAMRRGANGKPYLPEPYGHWGFNPSDSGGWLLLGLVEGADLGVDLELRRPRASALAIARRHFPAAEIHWLQQQADTDHAFLRLWTMKEALYKAIGRGLGYGLGRSCFQPDAAGRLRLAGLDGPAAPAGAWHCAELDLGPGHVGAAVCSGAARPVDILTPVRP